MIAETIPRFMPIRGSNQLPMNAPINPYYEIADKSESGTPYDFAGQPAGDKPDHQYDQETFV